MINRALLRVKAVQVLYAYFQNENRDETVVPTELEMRTAIRSFEKELDKSVEQINDLYLAMLSLVVELTRYTEFYLDSRRNKYLPTDAERNPNMRFATNMFATQLCESEKLAAFSEKYRWNADDDSVLASFYRAVTHSEHYKEYMDEDVRSYEADRDIWRKIFKNDVPASLDIDAYLEDHSIYWNDDLETVLSFVQKTIKRFTVDTIADNEIMTLADGDDDLDFVHTLFRAAIDGSEKYEQMIIETAKNWDFDRIAFMDTLIMKTALAEIFTFPTIPVSVTLNEYIEIAKAYSTPRSASFINGILDKIVADQRAAGKLVKPDTKL